MSRALHDQKESPKQRATWWVEYAIRNKGAPHMTYSGKRLHFLQYIMVDVMLFLVVVLVAWLLLSILCLRKVILWCRRPQKHALLETKKQK